MKTITLTEKRFFEWHEDSVSVTLRNKSGSYGGDQRFWSSNVIGVDLYNHVITGNVTMNLCCQRADPHHIPCVVIVQTNDEIRRNDS